MKYAVKMADIEIASLPSECKNNQKVNLPNDLTNWEEFNMLLKATQSKDDYNNYVRQYYTKTIEYYGLYNLGELFFGDTRESYLFSGICTALIVAPFLAAAIISLILIKLEAVGITLFIIFVVLFFGIMFTISIISVMYGKKIREKYCRVITFNTFHNHKYVIKQTKEKFKNVQHIDEIISSLKN